METRNVLQLKLRWGTVEFDLTALAITGKTADGKDFLIPAVSKRGVAEFIMGQSVQDAFPAMSIGDREILISGLPPEAFDATVGEGEGLAEPADPISPCPRWPIERRVPRMESDPDGSRGDDPDGAD